MEQTPHIFYTSYSENKISYYKDRKTTDDL